MATVSTVDSHMQLPMQFEIKIAVIGPVSAGKSTLINALLVGKYSEMATRRTTAGVNYFRLHTGLKKASENDGTSSTASWTQVVDTPLEAAEIHSQISKDNQELRKQTEVVERTFDIEGIELIRYLREDTRLVLVDIPGINEADSSSKYKDYVKEHWKTFDMVILVMDSREGVNSEEQVNLLQFVKNTRSQRNVPIVILLNKADDTDEFAGVIAETKTKIASMFEIPDNLDLASELDALGKGKISNVKVVNTVGWYIPAVLSFSARNAYLFRLASTLESEKFKKLEPSLVEVLGKEQVGLRRWNTLSREVKLKEAFEAITDPIVYNTGLQSSNYKTLWNVIDAYMGTRERQKSMLLNQSSVRTRSLGSNKNLAKDISFLARIESHITGIKQPAIPRHLDKVFWEHWTKWEERLTGESATNINWTKEDPIVALQVLIEYHCLNCELNQNEKASQVVVVAVKYLKNLVAKSWEYGGWQGHSELLVINQALGLSHRRAFLEHMDVIRVALETWRMWLYRSRYSNDSWCRTNSILEVLGMPNLSPSDKDHGGHIFWLFCEWIESRENKS